MTISIVITSACYLHGLAITVLTGYGHIGTMDIWLTIIQCLQSRLYMHDLHVKYVLRQRFDAA